MQTVQLDIQDDKLNTFLTIIDSLKNGIVDRVRLQDELLDIEKDSRDYKIIQQTKAQNNKIYSIKDAY